MQNFYITLQKMSLFLIDIKKFSKFYRALVARKARTIIDLHILEIPGLLSRKQLLSLYYKYGEFFHVTRI